MALVYAATLFLSAALLFTVQLMFSKMVLPLLGGSPAVWTTCMLFFQAVLLLGYAYAHGTSAVMPFRRQAPLHLVLVLLSLALLPVRVPAGWVPPPEANPVPWLLGLLAVALGGPFFVLSATAPLLQHWFTRADHPAADNPYFLYAASNGGSLLALLAYPVLIEPNLPLAGQRRAWALGYRLLVLALAACSFTVRRPAREPQPERHSSPPPTWRTRLTWTLLALVPSSLLLGVTTYMSTDIAAVPLLWVVPLALYLLTFVLVFAPRPISHTAALRVQPYVLLPLIFIWFWGIGAVAPLLLVLHLVAFFSTALVCHGELARRRPAADRLTEFYLWLAVGGALGGIFNAVVAPHLFSTVLEYPLMLIVACALRPASPAAASRLRVGSRVALALLPAALMTGLADLAGQFGGAAETPPMTVIVIVSVWTALVAAICFSLKDRPFAFAGSLAGILLAGAGMAARRSQLLLADRNFFGVHRVKAVAGGRIHTLAHGSTLHGAQFTAPQHARDPLAYYAKEGPLGWAFADLPPESRRRVAVVGLGAGAITAYADSGEDWTFYEIDPAVVRIARDTSLFTYLSRSPAPIQVVLGDARLSLQRVPDGSYTALVLDAFSSDAIPVHLLTREAITLYRSKLSPHGLLLLHLSNRHLELRPVVGELMRDIGWTGRVAFGQMTVAQHAAYKIQSLWAVLARHEADLGSLAHDPRWRPLPVGKGRLWTDDYSDIWSVLEK